MEIAVIEYIEINLLGVVLLLIMLCSSALVRVDSGNGDQRCFSLMLISNMLILLSDTMIIILRCNTSSAAIIADWLFCTVYFGLHAFFGYFGTWYCIKKLYPDYKASFTVKFLLLLPSIAGLVLTASSPWTRLVFEFNAENHYQRGKLFFVIVILSYLYWILNAVITVYDIVSKKSMREDKLYFTLLFFPIPAILGNVIQLCFYGISVSWVLTTVSLLLLFINLQNNSISKDVLTGLNNRRQTDKQLRWETDNLQSSEKSLFVMMADVDSFKHINDTYGHVTGDKALISVARTLRTACAGKHFIGRFGGDEFIIIGHFSEMEEIEELINRIKKETGKVYIGNNGAIPLSLSVGYAVFGTDAIVTADAAVSAADLEMYKVKAANGISSNR